MNPIKDFIKTAFAGVKTVGTWVSETILTPTGVFFKNIFDTVKDKSKDVIDSFVKSVFSFFNFIGDTFGFIFSGDINIADVISAQFKDTDKNTQK